MVCRSVGFVGLGLALLGAYGCQSRDADEQAEDGVEPGASAGVSAGATGTMTGATTGTVTGAGDDEAGATGATTGAGAVPEPSPVRFDLGSLPDAPTSGFCGAPLPVVCDELDDDPWHAMGLNCPGGPQVDGVYNGHASALRVHTGNFGTHMPPTYPPREGEKFVMLSTGIASEVLEHGSRVSTPLPDNDPGPTLPAPLRTNDVSPTLTCADDPSLIGTGDCSNTIESQWNQAPRRARDYAELRFTTEVPEGTFGLSFDFAFFSEEFPDFYEGTYNDMFVAWLESEHWTGNVSFDDEGNPISLNAGFLDYRNEETNCSSCLVPELSGTAFSNNGATRWLTTQAPVTPGEEITLVFAIFDLQDNVLDSLVLLDNFTWNCEGGPPITIPG